MTNLRTALAFAGFFALTACGSGGKVGDECEVDADCDEGLECHLHVHDGVESDHGECEEHEHDESDDTDHNE